VADHRIVFTPSGLAGTVADGTTVLAAARLLGADLDSVCGGRGVCGRCQVTPGLGAFAKWRIEAVDESLSAPGETELGYRGARPLGHDNRLGCATTICGDVVVDIPAISQVHRQVVRKDLDLPEIRIDPLFSLCFLDVAATTLGDDITAVDAVVGAVAAQHERFDVAVPAGVLSSIQPALDRGHGSVTVALEPDGSLAAIWPGFVDEIYGVAIDVGSTTIAGHLCELLSGHVLKSGGRMNPQIRYGEDLMSRVSYVMMNAGGAETLTGSVRTALDELIDELATTAGVDADRLLEVVLVGNPIMHHLVLGIDPTPLGQAPFTLATNQSVMVPAADLDLRLPFGRCYLGPCIAGHVGADTTAAILAERPHRSAGMQLLVDIGTNAEIVLGDRERLFAASSPTGPAFEGAQTSSGQRATTGAIERVRIDTDTLEPRIKVIGTAPWSDESGFDDGIVSSGVTGLCGSGIIDVVAEMFLARIIDHPGVIRTELIGQNDRVVADGRTAAYVLWDRGETTVVVTQNDVRAIQLAKAALRAGIDLLIERAGHPVVEEIRLAGAFGAHIDPLHAQVLGLVPDCPLDAVRSVGNAAGVGAVEALLSGELRSEMEATARDVVKIETATEPRFQELFVAAMAFPHASASTTHIGTHVAIPAPAVANATRRRGRRNQTVAPTEQPEETRT
jgi:uncharacterized 2Fe-2S/4Fe-4S cluster protein (DUF4445 family)